MGALVEGPRGVTIRRSLFGLIQPVRAASGALNERVRTNVFGFEQTGVLVQIDVEHRLP